MESKFNWDGFPNGPVTKKDFEHWNKMNTDYYLVIYSFEGLSEETTKEDFLREVRVFMYPPKNREGKTPIYLLLATSFKNTEYEINDDEEE